MASKYLQKYPVPAGFQEILADFTREVLRDQPSNIIEYGAKYFETLEKGKKMQYDSKYNVRKDDKKYELSYNPKNAEDITKRASSIAQKVDGGAQSSKTVNQEVESYVKEQNQDAILKEQIEIAINQLYDQYDKDKNQLLESNQLKKLTQDLLGVTPTQEMLQELTRNLDLNGDGKISKEEFNVFVNQFISALQ